MEIVIDEIHKNTSSLKYTESKFTEIEDTINKINDKNKKINILLNNITNLNNKTIINKDYENPKI